MKAKELVRHNESAIVIFTDGRNLDIRSDGNGYSGNWRINRSSEADKVIVYFRNPQGKNEIYLGNFTKLLPSTEAHLTNRFAVGFTKMKFAGFTESNWNQFTDTRRGAISPVKFVR